MYETFVVDVDGTLSTIPVEGESYACVSPYQNVIDKVNALYDRGHIIILNSSRGMRSLKGDIVEIERLVRPTMETWLHNHNVKYHKLILGKPWGHRVHYVDDHAMHIDEFLVYEALT